MRGWYSTKTVILAVAQVRICEHPAAMLDAVQIEERLPVWMALHEFFLDTELQDIDFAHIAAVVKQSGYSRREIEAIMREEVYLAFWSNLWQVAGEWQPWSEDEVREIVVKSLHKRSAPTFAGWFRRTVLKGKLPAEWERLVDSL